MASDLLPEKGRPAPDHHDPGGGFRNPWPTFGRRGSGFRWALQRITAKLPSDPGPEEIPRVEPTVGTGDEASTRAPGGVRATWIGHATFLIEIGGLNVLTDPHWSERASPVSWAGPKRLSAPGVPFEVLPRIDAVLLSHDHLDHLDEGSVRALSTRYGSDVQWCTPLGYAPLLRKWGASRITELDWYDSTRLGPPRAENASGSSGTTGPLAEAADPSAARPDTEAIFLPAQHWTARSPFTRNRRLWGSWAIREVGGHRSVYFGGDSGWFPEYPEIGSRAGPFDLVILPIGAYAPRWFMKPVHMNPAEAVRSYQDLGGHGVLTGMHWGTFRLSDEHPLEPPRLLRKAWQETGLPEDRLWIPALGETRRLAE